MLKALSVTNFALIESAMVEFNAGLNVLTGETGAGKSILIDALNTILGGRSSADFIRTGCDYFRVEGVFEPVEVSVLSQLLETYNIVPEEDGALIISRRFTSAGKNTILINGCHVTLSTLRLFGQKLVDMHGQHENQALLRPETHLGLIDMFDENIGRLVQEYKKHYNHWQELSKSIINSDEAARERAQRLDMLAWQTDEIAAAALRPQEELELDQRIKVLSNIEKIAKAVSKAYMILNEGNKGDVGIMEFISEAKREIDNAARYDERLSAQANIITDVIYQLRDVSAELSDYLDNIDFDPNQLAEFQERMDVIYKLKKKYGASIDEVLAYYDDALAEIAKLNNSEVQIEKLSAEKQKLEKKLYILAEEIHNNRTEAASSIGTEVCNHLKSLGMADCQFHIEVNRTEKMNQYGNSEATILFSANAGESLKPLHKIASGGELSRVALALKTVCAHRDQIGTVVFDEIDTGIGGQTSQMVGERIAMVACHKQVLCITHSPQIACMADNHLNIEKQVSGDRTKTMIRHLDIENRKLELARMIAGKDLTAATLENALQMINSADSKKEIWKKEAQA